MRAERIRQGHLHHHHGVVADRRDLALLWPGGTPVRRHGNQCPRIHHHRQLGQGRPSPSLALSDAGVLAGTPDAATSTSVTVAATETVTTLKGTTKVKTVTMVRATIHLTST